MADSIIAVSSHVRKTIEVAGISYGLGKIRTSYFVLNLEADTWRSFTSLSAFNWFVDELIAAGERLDPTPSAPASIRLIQQSTVAALSIKQFVSPVREQSVKREHVIKINPVRGERFPVDTPIDAAYAAYKRKYGFEATRHYVDATNSLYVTNAKAKVA